MRSDVFVSVGVVGPSGVPFAPGCDVLETKGGTEFLSFDHGYVAIETEGAGGVVDGD